MIKTIILSMCLAASSLSLNARAQDERQYTEGPVTEVDEVHVEYGKRLLKAVWRGQHAQ
jgi:hypothetical protein